MIRKLSIQAWEWIPKVTAADRENFERRARQDGIENFQIFELNRRGKPVPAEGREVYYPIFYAEPLAGNDIALGFDVSSNGSAKMALDEALENRLPTATNPLTLIQELGKQRGIVAYSPVFADGNLENPPWG
ncbi:CHASE domain-containing protein [Synechocystis sp. B12]|nr:CHASE domain-containing protein [Synechocystis sp. B12]